MPEPATQRRLPSLLSRPPSSAYAGTFIVSMLLPIDAFAYLDPGTGSIIIQGIIASIAAGLMVVRGYWHRIRTFFGKTPQAKSSQEQVDDDLERSGDR